MYFNIYTFMKDLRLTEHFTLREFERSAVAEANGIDNRVPSQFIPTLEQLCKTILEPLREFAQQPIIISSGYRCNQLNAKVGGAYASQHTLGEAADIRLPLTPYTAWDVNLQHTDMEIAERWFSWLQSHTDLYQLIMETQNGRDYWIHISCCKNKKANRHQVLRLTKK